MKAIQAASILLVSLALLLPAAEDVIEKTRKIKPGRRVEVTLKNGDKAVGKMGVVETAQFTLQPDKKGGSARTLTFAETESVKSKMTTGEKWAIGIAIWLGVTLPVAIAMGG